MNYIKTTLLSALFLGLLPMAQANAQVDKVLREKDPEFFKTAEARRIGDQLLVWQRNTGGWPKNVDMVTPLTDQQREVILKDKHVTDDSTIDNGATTTQMNFLARLYQQTKDEHYREAFQKGVHYILGGQYENGGWPQFWPTKRDYQVKITYNDDAMVNILNMMRDILKGKEQYAGLSDDLLNELIDKAFKKGIECILNTQIRVDDTLTVWCQQHDRKTLYPPTPARTRFHHTARRRVPPSCDSS